MNKNTTTKLLLVLLLTGFIGIMNPFNAQLVMGAGSSDLALKTQRNTFSAIKISLKAEDTIATGLGSFMFDADGFNKTDTAVFQTSGGLEPNEAWLASDREGNGFFNNAGILDGSDLFGDHKKQYESGYEELEKTFSKTLQVDKDQKRFIELHELSAWDEFWTSVTRFFGLNRDPNPSYDLKLLTSSNAVVPAASIVTKIYVDANQTDEHDISGKNVTLHRSTVAYKNGKSAQSGDQWFMPLAFLVTEPAEKK